MTNSLITAVRFMLQIELINMLGIVLIVIGLGFSLRGAYKTYHADFPRNNWILQALAEVATRPRYAVIAPDDYDPQKEREMNQEQVEKIKIQTEKYATSTRKGMKLIFIGFVFQFLGSFFIILHLVGGGGG